MRLDGQVSVITGAGRGIGRTMAIEHAAAGARVALVSRSADELDGVATEIRAAGGTAEAFPVDVRDTAAVAAMMAAIEARLGPIDLLVNNAGSFRGIGPIWTVDPEAWWGDIEINLRGPFNCCRAALPAMIARGGGRIINLTGGGTGNSFPNGSGYGSSKAGLMRFTECVSDTLAGTGVLMFAMDPGLVHTSMTDYQLTSEAGRAYLPGIQGLFDRAVNVSPSLASQLTIAIGTGRFDRMAGRMFTAARGDIDLSDETIDRIVASDFRSLRINGMPEERGGKLGD